MSQQPDDETIDLNRELSSAAEILLDEYLEHLRGGSRPELDEYLARLATEPNRSGFRIAALAESFLIACEERLAPRLRDTLDRAATEAECRSIRNYIEDSKRAGRLLPAALTAGVLLAGRYRIERELGRGGQAVVYAAFDEDLGIQVAIKVINSQTARDAAVGDWEENVRHEARLLANLNSRNIVRIYDAQADEQYSYIVMGRVAGIDAHRAIEHLRAHIDQPRPTALSNLLGTQPTDEHQQIFDSESWDRTVARIGVRAAHALEAAHGAGVLHRDLKPQNVMLISGGEPVLLDFGLAARPGDPEFSENVKFHGTIPYVAPEQARFYSTGTDPRTDLYQLGLVLYELLVLEPAFSRAEDESVIQLIERKKLGHFQKPRDLRPNTHPALDAILCKALAAELDDRYSNAKELRDDLERFERRLPPIVAQVETATAIRMRLAYAARRPITLVAVVALALLVAVYALRTPGWVPPDLHPILLSDAGQKRLTPGDTISLVTDSSLGLQVDAPDRAVLYAFAVSGGKSNSERFLKAVLPEVQGQFNANPPEFGRLELEPGEATITCSWFDANTERHANEGLLVYICREPNATLDTWQAQLNASGESGLFEVSYDEAMALASQLFESGSRGETAATVDPSLRARFLGKASQANDSWQNDGFRRSEYLFTVQSTEKENQ
ncbi:MAG: serine/threonine protein kinase [Planctomycetota bacterium]